MIETTDEMVTAFKRAYDQRPKWWETHARRDGIAAVLAIVRRDFVVLPRPAGDMPRRVTALPKRLAQVLPLVADGLTDEEIADRLSITAGSVRGIVQRLVMAYSASGRAHMIALAFRQGDLE